MTRFAVFQFNHRQRFQVFQMTFRIIIENDARVHQVFRIKEFFHRFHHFERLFSPLIFYKWSHIPSGSVLRFQRTIVFIYHKSNHVVHQTFVTLNFLFGIKRLVDYKMEISFQRMSVNTGIVIAVFFHQILQIGNCFG